MNRKRAEIDPEDGRRPELAAGLYGLFLRERGYTAAEAAQLVIERYPWARLKLGLLAKQGGVNDERATD
jgi:hypothetical protein